MKTGIINCVNAILALGLCVTIGCTCAANLILDNGFIIIVFYIVVIICSSIYGMYLLEYLIVGFVRAFKE